ncbi:MAG TPA: 16S rRNA (guanine(527)-N(7))-methyltransferase RsmG [Edaphocola sp.]|nr:16S rRNA (guanine(527)-N(7))-methyltransferase RsmG [Edaphocola sp.]
MEIINKYFSSLSCDQLSRYAQLEALYRYWNERINIISRKDLDELYERHVLHSLSIAKIFTIDPETKVVDIGTGGGFPGIPLAIMFPRAQFVLVDSIGKKIKVVREVINALGLTNVKAVQSRAEDLASQKFDLALTRAVAPLNRVSRWAQKILSGQNQGLICLKGGDLNEEIKAAGLKTKSWCIHEYFPEPFFETKFVTWSEIPV